jgi:hypothetical protein
MKKHIINYKSGYNTQTNRGAITIYFEDSDSKDFLDLALEEFIALMMVLKRKNVYWDGTWVEAG